MLPVRLALAAALIALLAACSSGSGDEPAPSPAPPSASPGPTAAGGNLFLNPGFEEGADPWITLAPESGFAVTPDRAHSGASSALLRMRDPVTAEGAKVYYLVQEITPDQFPEVLRGFYRVENWQKGTIRHYLQFVVIALRPTNFPSDPSNYQIRYPLAGIDSPPFPISNAFFKFLGREQPVQGEWVPFESNIRQDFLELWGKVPEDFEKLRILFEVRWDGKTAGDGAPEADVYYDDLYVGPAAPG